MLNREIPKDRRGDPWFEDGNIILLTDLEESGIAFKVHRGVLSRHSEIFKTMFELAQPPDAENVDDCPVVRMPDLPNELSSLIIALYDGVGLSLQNRSIDDFFYVAGILRLSSKYCITHLRTQAIRHLTQTWSNTLRGHDEMLELALKTPAVDNLSYPFVHPLHVLNLARATDVRVVMPSALYFLSLYPLTDLLRGDHPKLQVEHPSRPSSDLTAQDLEEYTLMFQYRINKMLDFVRRTCAERTPAKDCTNDGQCVKPFTRLAARLSLEWVARTGPLHFMVQAMDEVVSYPNICVPCRKEFRQDVTAARQEAWKSLPSAIGLPPWEELEASDLEGA